MTVSVHSAATAVVRSASRAGVRHQCRPCVAGMSARRVDVARRSATHRRPPWIPTAIAAPRKAAATHPLEEKAWTESGSPDRVRAMPASTHTAAAVVHARAVADLRACNAAIRHTRGASAVFSTGSHAHQPPHPSSSWAHHAPSSDDAISSAVATRVQRGARRPSVVPGTCAGARVAATAAASTAACARYSSGGCTSISGCSRTGLRPAPASAGSVRSRNGAVAVIRTSAPAAENPPIHRRAPGSVPPRSSPSVRPPESTARTRTVTTRANHTSSEPAGPAHAAARRRAVGISSRVRRATSTSRRSSVPSRHSHTVTASAQEPTASSSAQCRRRDDHATRALERAAAHSAAVPTGSTRRV